MNGLIEEGRTDGRMNGIGWIVELPNGGRERPGATELSVAG